MTKLDLSRDPSFCLCPAVEREHDIIVKTTVGLHNAVLEGRSSDVTGQLIDLLERFFVEHFAHEESLMHEHGYDGIEQHSAAHRELLKTVKDLQSRSDKRTVPTAIDTLDLLRRLSEHTNLYDRRASTEMQKGLHVASAAAK